MPGAQTGLAFGGEIFNRMDDVRRVSGYRLDTAVQNAADDNQKNVENGPERCIRIVTAGNRGL
jgi:hypothetical protein